MIIYLSTPSTHSSMKVKDRVCNPSPHISNLSVEVSFDKKQQEPSPFHLYDKQQSDKLLKCKKIQNKN
jgi:hypothetical protein